MLIENVNETLDQKASPFVLFPHSKGIL